MQAVYPMDVVHTHPAGDKANRYDSGVSQLFCDCSFRSCERVWWERLPDKYVWGGGGVEVYDPLEILQQKKKWL